MTIEKAIEALKMDNKLMLFDLNSGEEILPEFLNKINKEVYDANIVAIQVMEKAREKSIEEIEQSIACAQCDWAGTENCNICEARRQ